MPSQRAVDRLHRIAAGQIRIVAHPGLVELDHVGAGLLQVERFGVDGLGERHRQLLVVLVELVLGLLAHRERAGQGDLRRAVGIAPEKLHVAQFDRLRSRRTGPTTRGTGVSCPTARRDDRRIVDHRCLRARSRTGWSSSRGGFRRRSRCRCRRAPCRGSRRWWRRPGLPRDARPAAATSHACACAARTFDSIARSTSHSGCG